MEPRVIAIDISDGATLDDMELVEGLDRVEQLLRKATFIYEGKGSERTPITPTQAIDYWRDGTVACWVDFTTSHPGAEALDTAVVRRD